MDDTGSRTAQALHIVGQVQSDLGAALVTGVRLVDGRHGKGDERHFAHLLDEIARLVAHAQDTFAADQPG